MTTEDNTFRILKRISYDEMKGILLNESTSGWEEWYSLLKQYNWTSLEFDAESKKRIEQNDD
jgi:hypothetical protein